MTINEIAKLAGVSRATISRYLNDGYVSQDKRDKIKQIIEETGYTPSSYAQTLRSKKTNYDNDLQPENIYPILITFWVLKFDKSIDDNDLQ